MMPTAALRQAATGHRIDSLFKAMSTDFLLREQFVSDPSQVICDFVFGARLSDSASMAMNLVIYSIAASRPLLVWMRQYALSQSASRPSVDDFLRDFSQAVAANEGQQVVQALVSAMVGSDRQLTVDHLTVFRDAILQIFGPGPDQPGGVVTVGTPIGDTDDKTWKTDVTKTIFTAGGTVTGTTTVTDLVTWHTGTDDKTGTDKTGTDKTGTDKTGTDSSITQGDISGLPFSELNYAAISLAALNRYATNLLRSGAMGMAKK